MLRLIDNKFYVFENPKDFCTRLAPGEVPQFAEVDGGFPVHPAELKTRVIKLLKQQVKFSTLSDTVLALLERLQHLKKLEPFVVIFVTKKGVEVQITADDDGRFITNWPEGPGPSVLDACFHYRFLAKETEFD